ncbi:MAG: hypothetical protein JO048_04370 [Methylobacteriaceae bacterium]|nr:hypothetical protein [Methylobacteriaceae bacterium]
MVGDPALREDISDAFKNRFGIDFSPRNDPTVPARNRTPAHDALPLRTDHDIDHLVDALSAVFATAARAEAA